MEKVLLIPGGEFYFILKHLSETEREAITSYNFCREIEILPDLGDLITVFIEGKTNLNLKVILRNYVLSEKRWYIQLEVVDDTIDEPISSIHLITHLKTRWIQTKSSR